MEIEIDIDEILSVASRREKCELYRELGKLKEVTGEAEKQRVEEAKALSVRDILSEMQPHCLKRLLCDVFNVSSYCNEQELRDKLETIIKA